MNNTTLVKVSPDRSTCSACIETQSMFNVVDDCSKCGTANRIYELINTGANFWGSYAIVKHEDKLEKVSLDRITVIE